MVGMPLESKSQETKAVCIGVPPHRGLGVIFGRYALFKFLPYFLAVLLHLCLIDVRNMVKMEEFGRRIGCITETTRS